VVLDTPTSIMTINIEFCYYISESCETKYQKILAFQQQLYNLYCSRFSSILET
jgi:hypothetical protein